MEAEPNLPPEAVIRLVEANAHRCAANVNNRDFNPLASGFEALHPDIFQAESSHPEGGEGGSVLLTKAEFINMHKAIADANPTYRIQFVGLTTEVYTNGGFTEAQGFMTIESTGIPEGVVRQSIGVSTWRYMEGKWFCVHYAGIRGSLGHQY